MFFSVIKPMKIAGKVFIPCICYEVNKFLKPTLKELEKEGTVTFYEKKVYFSNGNIIPDKKVIKIKKEHKKEIKEEKDSF